MAIVVAVSLSVVWFTFVRHYNGPEERKFLRALSESIILKKDDVKLSDLTDFEWDRVCVFYDGYEPYSNNFNLLVKNGIEVIPDGTKKYLTSIRNSSDIRLFIFSKDSVATRIIYLNRSYLKSSGKEFYIKIGNDECYRYDAKFVMEKENNRNVLRIKNKEG